MNLPKEFEYYIKNKIVNDGPINKSRAEFLIKESQNSFEGINERVLKMGIDNKNANSIIKDCYDAIMELIRAKMLLNGLNASGSYAHEAEVSYLGKMGFPEDDIRFMNELRYHRNSITYYGKILNKEYAETVVGFLEKIYPKLKKALK